MRKFAHWANALSCTVGRLAAAAGFAFLLNLLFAVVLLGLFLHSQSRQYERIWFR